MRAIRKKHEPASLTYHRSSLNATYDNYPDKDRLRQDLVSEQRGLCCYCLSRIRPSGAEMKIEHWHSQAEFSGEQLDYPNLLGACLGHEGQARPNQHCDTFKGDLIFSRNPADAQHRVEDFIRYKHDGTIYSDDPALNDELNRVLNLNCALLKKNRGKTLDGLLGMLPKRGQLPPATWKRLLQSWNGESDTGELQEFCQIVVYWLRKRLRKIDR